LLRRRPYGALVGSNTLTALGTNVQQLLQGWLAVEWGHSVLFLLVFGAARVLPKVALTVPAGVICDRVPRTRILLAARSLNVLASLLPLGGFVLPMPFVWLISGIALGGALHAFDLPASRAVLGDVTKRDDLFPVVALSNGGSHLAALIGPPAAYLMGPAGFAVSAALLAAAAVITMGIPRSEPLPRDESHGIGVSALVRFALGAPSVTALVVLGLAPGVVDKAVVLVLPSVAHEAGIVSMALLAPEIGGMVAAVIISFASIRFGVAAITLSAIAYVVLLVVAFGYSYESEVLISGLALAGAAKLAFFTSTQVQVQERVPAHLRGRVLSF
jgi:MFS family permease